MKNNNSVSKALIKYIKEKEISISQISKDTGICNYVLICI